MKTKFELNYKSWLNCFKKRKFMISFQLKDKFIINYQMETKTSYAKSFLINLSRKLPIIL